MKKAFKISKEEIKPIVKGFGGCFASDMITVEGHPVRFMYREEPDFDADGGWRFLAGNESQEYLDNPENLAIYNVNTIANYDPSIVPFLTTPIGSAFEKTAETERFIAIEEWESPEE